MANIDHKIYLHEHHLCDVIDRYIGLFEALNSLILNNLQLRFTSNQYCVKWK